MRPRNATAYSGNATRLVESPVFCRRCCSFSVVACTTEPSASPAFPSFAWIASVQFAGFSGRFREASPVEANADDGGERRGIQREFWGSEARTGTLQLFRQDDPIRVNSIGRYRVVQIFLQARRGKHPDTSIGDSHNPLVVMHFTRPIGG